MLNTLLPSSLPDRLQIIKLCNSLKPLDYRQTFIEELSTLRIGVVAGSLTYGSGISNISRVVIFHLYPSLENMKQTTRRPGRNDTAALVYTFTLAWSREYEIITQKDKDDLKRPKILPPIMILK